MSDKTREQLEAENQAMRDLLERIREEDARSDGRAGSGFWTEDIDEVLEGEGS